MVKAERIKYIRVKLGPSDSEMVRSLRVQDLIILFCGVLKPLKDDCNEKLEIDQMNHENK